MRQTVQETADKWRRLTMDMTCMLTGILKVCGLGRPIMALCGKLYSDAWNHSVMSHQYLCAGKDCVVWCLVHLKGLGFDYWFAFICTVRLWRKISSQTHVWSAALRGLRERTSTKIFELEQTRQPLRHSCSKQKDWIRRYWCKNVLLGWPAWHFPKREMHQIWVLIDLCYKVKRASLLALIRNPIFNQPSEFISHCFLTPEGERAAG